MPAIRLFDEWELREGGITPLGATWDGPHQSYQFVLYSQYAGKVVLLLYGATDFVNPLKTIPLNFPENKTSRYWHIRVKPADAAGAKYYAYQVYPAPDPGPGARFDPDKILFDPYAKGIFFPPGHDRGAACRPGSNAGKAPLGVLPPPADPKPSVPAHSIRHGHDLVVYELHVRGFTNHPSSGVPAPGTFSGVTAKIPYLKELGITAVELMPVHQFDPKEGNYFGYMTLSFFTPHLQYGSSPEAESVRQEFRQMVDALHAAEIEVYMDVVYNHTTEAGPDGPVYSYRGIDNDTYYVLAAPDFTDYVNFSACGNDLRTADPAVRRMVIDSLRYWAGEMGIDGFRFDLASILARTETGELDQEDPPLISEMSDDDLLSDTRLIAEPWQGAYGSGYMMGSVFPGKTWRQWNDHFRTEIRSFVKGDPGLVTALMTRLYGNTDLFLDDLQNAFRRFQSVNYVDSHDGLCLYDLTAYTNDGQQSWNCGYEGDQGAPTAVMALRKQQVKNYCCLLMLSNGMPMFCAGDEFLRTQGGDDNPWNQDNATSWVDWTLLQKNQDIFRFFQLMIALRKANPAIARSVGWKDQVRWHGTGPDPDFSSNSRSLAYFLAGSQIGGSDLYVMINADYQPLNFTIQEGAPWKRAVDTSLPSGQDILPLAQAAPLTANNYLVQGRSVVVLVK